MQQSFQCVFTLTFWLAGSHLNDRTMIRGICFIWNLKLVRLWIFYALIVSGGLTMYGVPQACISFITCLNMRSIRKHERMRKTWFDNVRKDWTACNSLDWLHGEQVRDVWYWLPWNMGHSSHLKHQNLIMMLMNFCCINWRNFAYFLNFL